MFLLNLQKPNNEKPISMIIHTIKKTQALLMHIVRFILGEEALMEGQSKNKRADIPVRSWIDICTNTYCTSLLVRQKWSSSICRSWQIKCKHLTKTNTNFDVSVYWLNIYQLQKKVSWPASSGLDYLRRKDSSVKTLPLLPKTLTRGSLSVYST